MRFITAEEVERSVSKNGMLATLKLHGRARVAPGFTAEDYIKIGEFFLHASHPRRGDLAYWDKVNRDLKKRARK